MLKCSPIPANGIPSSRTSEIDPKRRLHVCMRDTSEGVVTTKALAAGVKGCTGLYAADVANNVVDIEPVSVSDVGDDSI